MAQAKPVSSWPLEKYSYSYYPNSNSEADWCVFPERDNLYMAVENRPPLQYAAQEAGQAVLKLFWGVQLLEEINVTELTNIHTSTGQQLPLLVLGRSPVLAFRYSRSSDGMVCWARMFEVRKFQVRFESHNDFEAAKAFLAGNRCPVRYRPLNPPGVGEASTQSSQYSQPPVGHSVSQYPQHWHTGLISRGSSEFGMNGHVENYPQKPSSQHTQMRFSNSIAPPPTLSGQEPGSMALQHHQAGRIMAPPTQAFSSSPASFDGRVTTSLLPVEIQAQSALPVLEDLPLLPLPTPHRTSFVAMKQHTNEKEGQQPPEVVTIPPLSTPNVTTKTPKRNKAKHPTQQPDKPISPRVAPGESLRGRKRTQRPLATEDPAPPMFSPPETATESEEAKKKRQMQQLEQMIIDALSDDEFFTMCESVAGVWQRIGFENIGRNLFGDPSSRLA